MDLDAERPEGPYGFVQWKGTDVCVDLRCDCGEQCHYDGDFLYSFACPYCGKVWELVPYVRLVPGEDDAFVKRPEKSQW